MDILTVWVNMKVWYVSIYYILVLACVGVLH